MKLKTYFINIFLTLFMLNSYAQTQQKIPWPSLADSPWPVARGDVQGTGRSEYVGPTNPYIAYEQTYPLGILNGPVLDTTNRLYFGSEAGRWGETENYFYCTDSVGNQIWRFTSFDWVANDCAPAVAADGTIYFGSQGPDPAYFYAMNNDGTLKWSYETNSPINLKNIVLDKIGNIYFATQDSLYSLSSEGTFRFSLGIPGILGHGISLSPSGDTLYAPSVYYDEPDYIHHLYSVKTTGEVLWKKQFDRIALGQTILVDNSNRIYVQVRPLGSEPTVWGRLYCLNPDGSINWVFGDEKVTPDGVSTGGPTMDKEGNITFFGAIEVAENERRLGLAQVDYEGNLRWTYVFELEDWFEDPYFEVNHGLVSDANGTIYAAASYGYYLYAISKDGEMQWKLRLKDYYVDAGPVIGKDQTIYIGMHHGFWEQNLTNNLLVIKDKPNSVEDEETPKEFDLYQNYPNPFNPTTRIKYQVASTEKVNLIVYDILGREIVILVNDTKTVGSYEVEFDASDLPSGVYFYRLNAGGFSESKKMLLLK